MGSMIDYNYLDTVNNSNISQPLLQRCNHANISNFLFLGYEIPNRLIWNMRHDNFLFIIMLFDILHYFHKFLGLVMLFDVLHYSDL